MFGLTITATLPDEELLREVLTEARRDAAEDTMEDAIDIVTRRIDAGVRPDGSSYRKLAESTIKRKGSSRVLYDTGLLSRASEWIRERDTESRRAMPPRDRERIVGYLDRGGRPVFADVDPDVEAAAHQNFDKRMRALDLGRATKTRVIR